MVLWLSLGCASPCPPRSSPAAEVEIAARDALRAVAPDLADVPATVCVAEGEAAVHPGEVVVLDGREPPAARAARLGHLLLHVREGFALRPGPSCLAEAVAAEERALAREDALRARWGLDALPPDALDTRQAAYAGRCRTEAQ